jgi:hypothetical protein
MKFSPTTKHQVIQYRICDELACKAMAIHVVRDDYLPIAKEYHLCESHFLKYKAELKDNDSKSNS